jgi:hypothetical protein
MSVIVEFSISTEDFLFGSTLATVEEMNIELEAIVPTGRRVVPYFWATGEDFESFERHVLSDPDMTSLTQLDRIDETALYRAEWSTDLNGVLVGLGETEAVVLEAVTVDGGWHFRVRFPDHDLLGQFYNFCTERDYGRPRRTRLHARGSLTGRPSLRTHTRTAGGDRPRRPAGVLRFPRETDLAAIADERGISQQAASKRVRRGASAVLRGALFGLEDHR